MVKLLKINTLVVALLVLLVSISCNQARTPGTLRIATAANLRFAMEDINNAFEKESGDKVEMITASSGKLTAQIENGAPFDVFLSASFKYPQKLYEAGHTIGTPELFCKGMLVAWTNKNIPIDSILETLLSADIQKIGIANPQNAPYGIAAEEVLKKLNLFEKVKSKLIYAENVSQLNQYILNKVVDVGLTSKSAVLSPQLKNIGIWKEISPELYSPVMQYVVKLKFANKNSDGAKQYVEFLKGKKAKAILRAYGYE